MIKEVKILIFFTLKTTFTNSHLDRTTSKASAAFKRPLAVKVGDGNNKYCLANVLAHLKYHVALLNSSVQFSSDFHGERT